VPTAAGRLTWPFEDSNTVTDTPTPPETTVATPTPPTAPTGTLTVGFLTVLSDAGGVLGGYLVTNAWGRPLEFRLSTAVQPNRVQQILYGPTLTEYLHADLIGKTLVDRTSIAPQLIVVDTLPALALRHKVEVPVVAVRTAGQAAEQDVTLLHHDRCSTGLLLLSKFAAERPRIDDLLNRLDDAIDLAEPFARIRDAVTEARKMGVSSRAA
jgi:hypothetical protein